MSEKTFEECCSKIDDAIAKSRKQWQLNAIAYMDYDDVAQILRSHIYVKWGLWDQSRPIEPWLFKTIKNQIWNIIRNNYGRLAPPCSSCPCNQGDGLCSLTKSGKQDSSCGEYKKWSIKKKDGYNMKLAKSIDASPFLPGVSETHRETSFDLTKSAQKIHRDIQPQLNTLQKRVYRLLFIEGRSDEEAAKDIGFISNERDRFPGYKQIHNIRKQIIVKVKVLMEKKDIVYDQ